MVMLYRTISNVSSTRSKLGREDIKWSELLSHFRAVQNRHEKARRQSSGEADISPVSEFSSLGAIELKPAPGGGGTNAGVNGAAARPAVRRRVTGASERPPSRALSPLNPRSTGRALASALNGQGQGGAGAGQTVLAPALTAGGLASPTFVQNQKPQGGPKRTLSVSRKT